MKAEDTVMSHTEKKDFIVERSHQQTVGETQEEMLLLKQAEISFKAGQESGCFMEGWASGIKEVVERGNGLLDRYSQSNVTSFWMEVVSQTLTDGG